MNDQPPPPPLNTVGPTKTTGYTTGLREPGRPPSKGGNTSALHGHRIEVDGIWYSFLALGKQKWVFASDTVAFDWTWDPTQKFRNIVKDSIRTWDRRGAAVVRGNHGSKSKLRTAQTRLPARRREIND